MGFYYEPMHDAHLFEAAREMIPQNEPRLPRQTSARALSWMDRFQLKLESLCETEAAKNPGHLVQETSAYFEKQITTAGTNVRNFCAEFAKEFLLPETGDKVEATQVDTLQVQSNGLRTGNDKSMNSAKPAKLVDAPVFNPEGSISGSSLEDEQVDQVTTVQQLEESIQEAIPLVDIPIHDDLPVLPTVNEQSVQQSSMEGEADQYAHWFVSEEYRQMRLGKSTSTASLQSCGSLQREPSTDSLLDWELV